LTKGIDYQDYKIYKYKRKYRKFAIHLNILAMKIFVASLSLILVLLIPRTTEAQRHEVGILIGGDYYLGDLVANHFAGKIGPNFGMLYRYDFNSRISARIAGHYGIIYGDSKDNRPNLRYKNLSFFSPILDIEMGMEINFLEFDPNSNNHRFTPFVFGGLSIFRFNPQTEYQGQVYELQPLGTEGQGTTAYPDRTPYRLMSWSIPFGGGLKWAVSKRVNLSLEFGVRKTFTDYLDDISSTYPDVELLSAEKSPLAAVLSVRMYEDWATDQGLNIQMGNNGQPIAPADYAIYLEEMKKSNDGQRGNSEDMDWYSIFGLSVTFKIVGPKKGSCPAYRKHLNFKEYLTF
jgi:hypothetical protein